MKIFLAGATGAIGKQLSNAVAGVTRLLLHRRSTSKVGGCAPLARSGRSRNVLDREEILAAVLSHGPTHQHSGDQPDRRCVA